MAMPPLRSKRDHVIKTGTGQSNKYVQKDDFKDSRKREIPEEQKVDDQDENSYLEVLVQGLPG